MATEVKNQFPDTWSSRLQLVSQILFHLLFLITPFLFTWVNDELFEFNKMLAVYAFSGAIIGIWLIRMVLEKRWLIVRSPLDWFLLAFVGSQVASTILSIHPHTSIWGYYSRFHGGLASTLCYVGLYYAALATFTSKSILKLWLSVAVGAIASALYAIPEHFGHSPSCWLITNGQQFGVDCWIQDVKSRIFGTFGQPNWLAAYMIMIIPLLGGLMITSWHRATTDFAKWRNIILGSLAISVAALALLYTKSRSGVLGLEVGLLVWFGLVGISKLMPNRREPLFASTGRFSLGMLGLILLLIALVGSPFTPSLKSVLTPPSPAPTVASQPQVSVDRLGEGGTDSGEIRKIVWAGAVDVWKRYPIFGSGVETFAYSYYQDRPVAHNLVSEWDFLYNKAHNEFLNFLATTGILGLGSYVALLGCFGMMCLIGVTKKAPPLRSSEDGNRIWLMVYAAGAAGLAVSNFLGFSTVMVTSLLFLFFAGTALFYSKPLPANATKSATLEPWQWILSVILLVVVAIWIWNVRIMWQADYLFAQGKAHSKTTSVQTGVIYIENATQKLPNEALYYDELSSIYGGAAASLSEMGQATSAAEVAESAITYSDMALRLNNRHLNFYKSRARLFITLMTLDPRYAEAAKQTLRTAIELSPTDAKLVYNLGLVELSSGEEAIGLAHLQQAIELKPNYESARAELGRQLLAQKKYQEARDQFEYIVTKINPNNQPIFDLLKATEASLSAIKPTK